MTMKTFVNNNVITWETLAGYSTDNPESPDYLQHYIQLNDSLPCVANSISEAWRIHGEYVKRAMAM